MTLPTDDATGLAACVLELIDDLRSYTHDWDWKYGEEWDRAREQIAAVFRRTTIECSACHEFKPSTEFHSKSRRCRPCKRKIDSGRAKKDPAKRAAWARTEHGRVLRRAVEREWVARNAHKDTAHRAVKDGVRRGRIHKPKRCESCGAETERRKLQGHHRDYSKPLEVMWLCHRCHVEEHV